MYEQQMNAVAQAAVEDRVAFIRRTYSHLVGAVLAFCVLSYALFASGMSEKIAGWALGNGKFGWLVFLGGFMAVGWIADKWARSDTSVGMQYLGLGLYVVAEALIFAPILYIAGTAYSGVVPTAGLLTVITFIGLTGTVFITKKDFSFLRGILMISVFAALGLIVAGAIFGFNLGLWFSVAMVLVAAGYVLYYTSNVLLHYRTDQHVAASLALFAAIALLFWYILRIVMTLAGRD